MRLRNALLFSFIVLAGNADAQVDRGGLAGTVTDSSGLVVPGAVIEATQAATPFRRSALTSHSGTFDIPELPVGRYTVAVSGRGFQAITVENVRIFLEHTTVLNFTLRVSGTAEQVEVVENESQLDLNSNTLGARFERKQTAELLLNGRNWATLTTLAPLAVDTNYGNSSNQRSIRVAGRGRDDNNFTYDGVDATNIINQAQQPYVRLAVPLDTIEEFRVVSMLATPETGATAGAQLSVTSRSGTNQFHGSVFNFLRNDAMDARSFIDPVKRPFHLNQFGATAGGPVVKDNTFFFAAYEGYRQNFGKTLVGFVPTDLFRQQISSQSPALAAVVSAYPEGSLPVANNPNVAEYIGKGSQVGSEDSGMIRVDHRFSDRMTMFTRVNLDRARGSVPLGSSGQYLNDVQILNSAPTNVALELFTAFSPSVVSETKFGFNRSTAYTTNVNKTGTLYSFLVPGLTTLNNNRASIGAANAYSGIENLTKVTGRHVLKVGVEIRRIQMNQGRAASGTVSFASLDAFANNTVNTASFTQALPVNGLRKFSYSGYFQDEFKWTPALTLNLGARYSFFNVFHEVNGRANPFDFSTCGSGGFCGPGASFGQRNYGDIDPRVAFAWAPTLLHGNTVVRAGFGIYHEDGQLDDQNVPESNEVMSFSLTQKAVPGLQYPVEPFLAGAVGVISPSAMQRNRDDMYVTQWGVSIQQSLPVSLVGTLSYVGSKGTHLLTLSYVNLIDPVTGLRPYPAFGQISWRGNESNSSYQGLQSSVQRTFRNGLLFSLNYAWSHEIDNGSMGSGDGDSLTPEIVGCPACDRASGTFDVRHVLSANAVYELPFGRGRAFLRDSGVMRAIFGGWQVTSIVVARTGFPVNVTVHRSAASVSDGNTNNQRPDIVPGVPLIPSGGSTPAEWMNLAAFAVPVSGTFGNAGRDLIRGPNLWQIDCGAAKRIAFAERYQLQFRAEAFNIFNRAQLGAPQSDISAGPGEFGRIIQPVNTSPIGAGTPRQIQLALRLEF
jgi:Carboxypeptidase regulatory-like domain/TonB dependent receptor